MDAVEGAEDSAANGARDLRRANISRRDVVVGLAASGTTPYVLGAIDFARRAGRSPLASLRIRARRLARRARIAIAPDTGPEAIAGSTRLKAGTAQKMVLNLLSTAAMARMGRVYDNWMVHVAPNKSEVAAAWRADSRGGRGSQRVVCANTRCVRRNTICPRRW